VSCFSNETHNVYLSIGKLFDKNYELEISFSKKKNEVDREYFIIYRTLSFTKTTYLQ
jgi:hypothetical protein